MKMPKYFGTKGVRFNLWETVEIDRAWPLKFLSYVLAAALSFGIAAARAAPIVVNGDFEAVQIGPPFQSVNIATDIPDWTHTGSAGDGWLWNTGFGGGSTILAGHGKQFVTIGGGCCDNTAVGSAAWTTTVSSRSLGKL